MTTVWLWEYSSSHRTGRAWSAFGDIGHRAASSVDVVEEVMSHTIAQLEKAWLQLEALADNAKREAMRASDELQRRNTKVVDAAEVKILPTSAEQAKMRQVEAERKASAAFDVLWQAKGQTSVGQGQQSVHA